MIRLKKVKKSLDFPACFRMVLKVFFLINSLYFSLVFAHLTSESLYKQLSSENPMERLEALQNVKRTTDKIIHRKVIEIALLDMDLEVRTAAENTLNNLSSVDAILNNKGSVLYSGRYNPYLKNLRAELLSIFPEEQIKALKSLKDIESAHPLIQYTVIKEFVFKSSGPDIQKELIRIADFDSYLQKWLMHVSSMDTVPDIVRDAANNIILQVKPQFGVSE